MINQSPIAPHRPGLKAVLLRQPARNLRMFGKGWHKLRPFPSSQGVLSLLLLQINEQIKIIMGDAKSLEQPRLLPSILDHRAVSEPERLWAKFPVSPTSYEQGFRAVTYREMQNAVNRMAWMITEEVGTSTHFDTLAYLGPGDLRYHIMLLATIKAGYKVYFTIYR